MWAVEPCQENAECTGAMQESWLYDGRLLEFWVSVLKYWQHSSACCPGGSALVSHTAELSQCWSLQAWLCISCPSQTFFLFLVI